MVYSYRILRPYSDKSVSSISQKQAYYIDALAYELLLAQDQVSSWQAEVQSYLAEELTAICAPQYSDIKAIFFDMDATVVAEETIVELARAAGAEAYVAELTEKAMAGELDFAAALRERVACLQGLGVEVLEQVAQQMTLQPGIAELAQRALKRGLKLFLVSGGFQAVAERVAQPLGFSEVYANRLEVLDGQISGRLEGKLVDAQAKALFVKSCMQRYGWCREQVVAVGDGANDSQMMACVGLRLGFRPKPVLRPLLDGAVFQGGHEVIADYLGL